MNTFRKEVGLMRRNIAKMSKIPNGCASLCYSDIDINLQQRYKAGNYKYKYKMFVKGLIPSFEMDNVVYQDTHRLVLFNYERIENCYKIFYLLDNYLEEW